MAVLGSIDDFRIHEICSKEHSLCFRHRRKMGFQPLQFTGPETNTMKARSIPKKILLPIDFSPSSQAALEMAADLAKHFQAKLYLVNVIAMFPPSTIPDVIPEATFMQESTAFAEGHLAKCKAALTVRGVKSTSIVEVGNDVVGKIMAVIERERIDMVILSTHGISGWHPLVFGSIAEKVIKLVQCPLLLLRAAQPGAKARRGATNWW
jgi:nucleotide-binding universal stress UspA family protein